jgi:hypothetical protein
MSSPILSNIVFFSLALVVVLQCHSSRPTVPPETSANASMNVTHAGTASQPTIPEAAVATTAAAAKSAATAALNNAAANAAVAAAAATAAANTAATAAATAAVHANQAASLATATANAAASANQAKSAAANIATSGAVSANTTMATEMQVVQSSSEWALTRLMQFALGLTLTMVVKLLCIAGNVLVQLSPLPEARQWEAKGSTGDSDAAPYVSIAFGGCQWCFYGMFAYIVTGRSGFLVLVQSNFLGAILGTYYVSTFYRNCRTEGTLTSLQKYLSGISSLVLLEVCSLSTLPAERALFLIGLISSFCSFMGATSVLVTVPAVIKAKDSSSIPVAFAVCNMASSFVWSLCGYIIEDPMVMIPNIFSVLCCVTSLAVKVIYSKDSRGKSVKQLEEEGALEDTDFSLQTIQKALMKQSCVEKIHHTELNSLHYTTRPTEYTSMKPDSFTYTGHFEKLCESENVQMQDNAFPNGFGYIKGTGQKLLAAATDLRQVAMAWQGDGTGGTF